MKSLAIKYKDNKDIEISSLNKDIDRFKKLINLSDLLQDDAIACGNRSHLYL